MGSLLMKRKNMKKILYILLILALTNCSASKKAKPCDICPQFSYIYYDTTILIIPHHNYRGMCFPRCEMQIISREEILIDQLDY
jgi:hypothetical protein